MRRQAIALIAAAVLIVVAWSAAVGVAAYRSSTPPPHRALTVYAPCPDPVVSTPYAAPFRPGGANFTVLADHDGIYVVTCP